MNIPNSVLQITSSSPLFPPLLNMWFDLSHDWPENQAAPLTFLDKKSRMRFDFLCQNTNKLNLTTLTKISSLEKVDERSDARGWCSFLSHVKSSQVTSRSRSPPSPFSRSTVGCTGRRDDLVSFPSRLTCLPAVPFHTWRSLRAWKYGSFLRSRRPGEPCMHASLQAKQKRKRKKKSAHEKRKTTICLPLCSSVRNRLTSISFAVEE